MTRAFARYLHRVVPLRRFVRQEDGAAAVEFGFVAAPFLLLLFMIIETALVFLASQVLETAVQDTSRLIMTGQAQGSGYDANAFKTAVCGRIKAMFDCSGQMYVDVRTYTSFSSINNSVTYDAAGKPVTNYSPGNAGDIVVVRLLYQWPIVIPLIQPYLADSSKTTRMLVATAAFRNEPYSN